MSNAKADCDAGTGEHDVRPTPRLRRHLEVLTEAQTASMQLLPQSHLEQTLPATVRHHRTTGRFRRLGQPRVVEVGHAPRLGGTVSRREAFSATASNYALALQGRPRSGFPVGSQVGESQRPERRGDAYQRYSDWAGPVPPAVPPISSTSPSSDAANLAFSSSSSSNSPFRFATSTSAKRCPMGRNST